MSLWGKYRKFDFTRSKRDSFVATNIRKSSRIFTISGTHETHAKGLIQQCLMRPCPLSCHIVGFAYVY
jgi:hypothetical protein